jgi:eukaryotic-like serine/threonine-protein kinase
MRIADHIENAEPVSSESHVYKAAKNGTFTAVHIFPFQLTEEQLVFFNKQAEQLSETYTEYRTAIPRVLSFGFTQTGSFPFIETEWIEGYSLADLSANEKALTVPAIINIAEEVSRVLAQCHKLGVLHGDINSKNIIWDNSRNQYTITGFRFGLRPSKSLYVKPSSVAVIANGLKNNTKSKQDDVQDIGRLLWQLLTGKDERHLNDNLYKLRFEHLPDEWTEHKKEQEQNIPLWLETCINKATGIDNEKPFENAVQLYSYILSHHKTPFQKKDWYRSKPQSFKPEPRVSAKKDRHFGKKIKLAPLARPKQKWHKLRFVFDRNIAAGLIVAALLLGFTIEAQKRENRPKSNEREATPGIAVTKPPVSNRTEKKQDRVQKPSLDTVKIKGDTKSVLQAKKPPVVPNEDYKSLPVQDSVNELGSYKVRSKAYFHNAPDETTRRNAFIVHWNNAVLHPLKEEGDFVYIVFTNHLGQTSKGWLKKQDLIKQ